MKNAVVCIGRFNPPTVGHYRVFDQMKEYIANHKKLGLVTMPIVVVIRGEKTDPKLNPLTAAESIKFMEASGRAHGVKFLVAKNAFDAFMQVREAGFEPLVIAAGSDRAADYKRLLDSSFKDENDKPITHFKLELIRDDSSTVNEKAASSTLARAAAQHDYFDEFKKITGLEDVLATKLFNLVKERLKNV